MARKKDRALTRNERIQKLLSEGLGEARSRGMHAVEDAYCAAYLAEKCAMLQEEQQARLGFEGIHGCMTTP